MLWIAYRGPFNASPLSLCNWNIDCISSRLLNLLFFCVTRENQMHDFKSETKKNRGNITETALKLVFWSAALLSSVNKRINQLHWSDSIQPVRLCVHTSCVCVSMCVYLPAKVSMQIESLRLCPIKALPLLAHAAFPLKPTVLTAEEEFYSHNDFHGCWLFGKTLFEVPLFCRVGDFSAQPAIIRANAQKHK